MPDDWKRWWKFAKEDQNMGHDNLETYPRGASYQLQQSGEKFLKAVLIAQNQDHALTHDLRTLLLQVDKNVNRSGKTMQAARLLTFVGGQSRYPSDYDEVTSEQAQALYQASLEIEAFAKLQIEQMNQSEAPNE